MRWLFLLIAVLNLFYYFWHQQQAPLRVTEVTAIAPYRESQHKLNLLSEVQPASPPSNSASAAPGDEHAVQANCLFLGDHSRREAAEVMLQRLRMRGIDGVVVSREVAVGDDYWVFLPPLASRQAAILQLRELQARNIDSYVITMGELENGISLGIYSQLAAAQSFVARVSGLGYGAKMRRLPRTHRRFVVQVSSAPNHDPTDILPSVLEPGMVKSKGPCEVVARIENVD